METFAATLDSPTATTKSNDPETVEDCLPESFPLTVTNTVSVKPETPEGPRAAAPLAAVNATTPAIADYSPLKWKKSKKTYHTLISVSFAFVV